jgi:DNA-binding HxlR family transcriptional regulator
MTLMTLESAAATPAQTRVEITRLAARGYTQVRHVLVQLPERGQPRASTLALMLHKRKHRALLLYIMLLTCWPWLADRRKPLQANVWIRALTADGGPTWSASTLSRAWADLENMGLIAKEREDRLVRVTPRREDGAANYEAPAGRTDRWNTYFALPDQFWTEEIFAKLTLPALAMLLVVAKETNGKKDAVWLTYENMFEWYGIRQKSAQNGLTELEKLGLVHRRKETVNAPLAPLGKTVHIWYSLTGDFGGASRKALQRRAKAARARRLKRNESPKSALKKPKSS